MIQTILGVFGLSGGELIVLSILFLVVGFGAIVLGTIVLIFLFATKKKSSTSPRPSPDQKVGG